MAWMKLAGALGLAAAAAGARADEYFAYTFIGATTQASGFLQAVTTGTSSLAVVSGSLDAGPGGVYSILFNPGATQPYLSPSGHFIVDNRVDMTASQPITWYGLLFADAGGAEVNIWSNGVGTPYTFYAHGPSGDVVDQGSFTITAIPAPGAATVLGVAGVWMVTGRRRPALA